jgi:hypothetical protein
MALIPVGRQQGVIRMLILAIALVPAADVVLVPDAAAGGPPTNVITTHRLLFREGIYVPPRPGHRPLADHRTSPIGSRCGTGSSTPER